MKAPAGKTPPKGRPQAGPQLRRSARKKVAAQPSPLYRGVVICDNVRDYKCLTRKTPPTLKKGTSSGRAKKDYRRKSTSEMKILSKKAERKKLQSTPTNKSGPRRSSLQPKKLF